MATWAALFAITGVLSLSYSTRISLSGNQFPEVYGSDERMKSTYRAAFGQSVEPAEVDTRDACSAQALRKTRARKQVIL